MVRRAATRRALQAKAELGGNPARLFDGVLSREDVDGTSRFLGHVWRRRLFTPLVTLWTFLSQVLGADKACRAAVARVLTFLAQTEGLHGSHDASAYCAARRRLPVALLAGLTRLTAHRLAGRLCPEDFWFGHRVKLVDGSSVQMPDTPENQKAYPQPSCQKPGCGFPVARLLGVFDLLTGALADLAASSLAVSETALFRPLWAGLEPGDVVVADGLFCTYADIALLREREVHVVMALHGRRKVNFREGKRLGPNDRLMTWPKGVRPHWMTPEEFAALPATQAVRVVRFRCTVPGWRTDTILVVTTLVDPAAYPLAEIAELYRRRWEVEVDLRHLKTTMKMEMLQTKTPEMVVRELWAHLLAYNLIRSLLWDAARRRRVSPLSLSLKGAIQEMMALWPCTAQAAKADDQAGFYDALLRAIAFHRVPYRPRRSEPRVIKRRPKNYPVMGAPRHECRKG